MVCHLDRCVLFNKSFGHAITYYIYAILYVYSSNGATWSRCYIWVGVYKWNERKKCENKATTITSAWVTKKKSTSRTTKSIFSLTRVSYVRCRWVKLSKYCMHTVNTWKKIFVHIDNNIFPLKKIVFFFQVLLYYWREWRQAQKHTQ